MTARLLDPSFKYQNAAQSSAPGYLAKRFELIRKQQAQKKSNVQQMTRRKA